jgi:hypothetical protein
MGIFMIFYFVAAIILLGLFFAILNTPFTSTITNETAWSYQLTNPAIVNMWDTTKPFITQGFILTLLVGLAAVGIHLWIQGQRQY